MKRFSVLVAMALALAGFTASTASPANPAASCCSGLAGSSRAGDAGAEAEVVQFVLAEAAFEGFPPGANFSDFSSFHLGSAEACLA
jgi:hypothetical protein